MATTKLGVAVLIVNKDFEDKRLNLPQLEKDLEVVKKTFGDIGFEIKEIIDQPKDKIIEEVKKITENDVGKDDKCFVCIVISHGDEDVDEEKLPSEEEPLEDIIFTYDRKITLSSITSLVTNEKCPKLKDKPRLFFVSACRGKMSDCGVAEKNHEKVTVKEYPFIPVYRDVLLAYGVPPGYQGYCDPEGAKKGSWYIHFLCKILGENYQKLDLTSILIQVAGDVAKHSTQKKLPQTVGQMPWYASMLTKQVYLSATGGDGKTSYW